MTLLFAFLIGLFAGFRSLTAPAMVAWAVYLGWLTLNRPLSLIGTLPAVIILSVLAVTEIVFDKLPTTPSRTAPPGLIARIIMGGLAGACIAANGAKGIAIGALLGAAGGIVGTFVGYQVRRRVVSNFKVPDFYVALVEDLITIGGCLWIVSRG
jgi:uncharacterized membrane protein